MTLMLLLLVNEVKLSVYFVFFFNDTATTEIYTLSLHDALPIYGCRAHRPPVHRHALPRRVDARAERSHGAVHAHAAGADQVLGLAARRHACARQGALQAHQRHPGSAAGGAGGRSATDSSSNRGSSSRSLSPRISRNCGVVPYKSGRPRPSPRVTTSTSPRSASLSITASESTPRISSTSSRPTGWR